MSELKICRICLRTECKVYKYDRLQLKCFYEEVMASKVNDSDNLPQYFCYECATFLHKFHKFKEKCYVGQKVLREMLWRGPITYQAVYEVDRKKQSLDNGLGIIMVSERVKTYSMPDGSMDSHDEFDDEMDVADDDSDYENKVDNDRPSEMDHQDKPTTMLDSKIVAETNDIQVISIKSEREDEDTEPKTMKFGEDLRLRNLSTEHWKRTQFTEEEAVSEFRARAKDPKYLKAAFRCALCFKGFSKQEMLKRHHHARHSESIGRHECRFCKMRFTHYCKLVSHMRSHYNKYQCLRCDLVCSIEQTALLHDEYHSGIVRKCMFCNEEFKHMSTYYTHLRTHRSEFVCTLCGVSFVSKAGLHQHKRRKHVLNEVDSPDDFEDLNTYCDQCDIRFETRKAYDEHLFHSAMHTDNLADVHDDIKKKILGKKEKAKITKELRKSNLSDIDLPRTRKRQKKIRRLRRKPTTCYQCGQHFATQQAYTKHHIAEHPRTSIYPTTERAICEICGASLAPGSVMIHMNMHSREKMHPCTYCDKSFHSSSSLTRHLVTHTGEKRFACSLCDKRFTQSNSMKLHYRTFHLKQPYPKRNRRKKKDELQSAVDDSKSDGDSDSLPEPDLASMPGPKAGIEPVPNVPDPRHMAEENMHYLTLT